MRKLRGSRRAAGGFTFVALLLSAFVSGCASYAPPQLPAISLSVTSFDFKTVVTGQTSSQSLLISNTGKAPLQIMALSISNKQFSIAGPSVPRVILPANSLTYTVTFTPTGSGNVSATLNITSNASNIPVSISLAGTGQKAFANLVITPVAISFGNLTLKSKSTQNVTLQNTGDTSLTIQGITETGAGFGYVDLSPGFSLAPNQKLTFQVWFSPVVAGPASAKVSFLSPNLASAETLSLSGAGVTAATPPPTNPPPPTQHTVHLGWNASSSSVIGYRVYRSTVSGGPFDPLNGTAVVALTFDDSTVTSGATYYYVVTAVDNSGNESVYSNQATAVIPSP